jgi:high affinity Mn2+ porin
MYKLSKLAAGSVIAATAAIGGAAVALADGYAPKGKVVYERPSDWSGVYFGVSSGYQWSTTDVANPSFPAAGFSSDHDSSVVGAHLGIQHQFGNVVLGVEGTWNSAFRDHEGSTEACGSPPVLIPGGARNCSARFNDVLTVGGRLGWAAGHWMPYLTGGYANGGFDFIARERTAAANLVEQSHTRLNGWYVGAGFEWTISPGWTTGIEYRHYDFDANTDIAFNGPALAPLEPARFEATTETITARVSWRWGRPEPKPLK